jgi:hypothetical protein
MATAASQRRGAHDSGCWPVTLEASVPETRALGSYARGSPRQAWIAGGGGVHAVQVVVLVILDAVVGVTAVGGGIALAAGLPE